MRGSSATLCGAKADMNEPSLDRQGTRRADSLYVARLATAPETRFLVIGGEKPAIISNETRTRAELRWFDAAELGRLGIATGAAIFLGTDAETGAGRFAVAIGERELELAEATRAALAPLVDVRSLAMQGVMSAAELALAAQAKSLALWHAANRHCGRCGALNAAADGGWRRVCPACGGETFPRVDPVVVMLVTDGTTRCVLARSGPFPLGVYSALAGFVEPGEDLAGAIRRETAEEVGVTVGEVTFIASQAWPFPHSLMLGCLAAAESHEIVIEPTEIEAARWFSREEVAQMLACTHPEGLRAPGREAIANWLIRHWLASG